MSDTVLNASHSGLEDDELANSFSQTLKVSNIPNNLTNCANLNPLADFEKKSLEIQIGRKISKEKSKKSKQVLRKAKLILPKSVSQPKKSILVFESSETVETHKEKSETESLQISCGSQYLNEHNKQRTQINDLDTNPDELASYFEQILFIPRPMSFMAEMMYA